MDKNGTINLLKPAGMTSHDAVQIIRRLVGQKRVGHTGTLDPMACGVLPICMGKSTRAIEYMDFNKKIYKCEMLLGIETDTQDIWGKVLSRDEAFSLKNMSDERITAAFETQKGNIMQIPPKYSAIRIDGKRMYEYARNGEDVDVPERPVTVYSLDIENIERDSNKIVFYVECSKGTYVRSICHEVGKQMGSMAVMSTLIRMESNGFRLEDSVTVEELEHEMNTVGNIDAFVGDVGSRLGFMGHIEIPEMRRKWFVNGGRLTEREYKVIKIADEEIFNSYIKNDFDFFNTYVIWSKRDNGEKEFLGVASINYNKEVVPCKVMV